MASKASELFEKTALNRAELATYRRIVDTVDDCTSLEPDLKEKINHIVYSKEVGPLVEVNTSNKDENLLGLTLKSTELSGDERQKLWRAVSMKLMAEPKVKVKKHFNFSRLNKQDTSLLDLKVKLDETQDKYCKNLLSYQKLLEQMVHIKLKDSKNLIDEKAECNKLNIESLNLKLKILEEQIGIAIFTEVPIARQAYQRIFDDITEHQNNLKREVKELKDLQEKYELVSCKKFNDILNSYRSYKNELAIKTDIWTKINSV